MPDDSQKNILHGITLETILTRLHTKHGWEGLYSRIKINCFAKNPSIKSALVFLRRTPWAREKVENLYCYLKPQDRGEKTLLIIGFLVIMAMLGQPAFAQTSFKHIPVEYIVALGDPAASSGSGAQTWGLWNQDPGPRGCLLENYGKLKASGGVAEAQWKFDNKDWWLEEHGSIMEKPVFPLPEGQYVVTGGREVTSILTVYPVDQNGVARWELANGAKLYDVTHLGCHAARYTPAANDNSCSPDLAPKSSFPVAPGIPMPSIKGCNKQEYSVLFVIGVAQN